MSSSNNVNSSDSLGSSSIVFIAPASGIASTFLMAMNTLLSQVQSYDALQQRLELEAQLKATKAAAKAARKEIAKDASSAIWQAVGGMAEGAFSIGTAAYMSRNTSEMKDLQTKIENAEGWKKETSNRMGIIRENNNNPNENNLQNNNANQRLQEMSEEQRTRVNGYRQDLKDESSRNNDTFGKKFNPNSRPHETEEELTYDDVLGTNELEDEKAISKNIDKYIDDKKKQLGELTNGGARSLQAQMIQGWGRLISGIAGMIAANELLAKKQYTHKKMIAQNAAELDKALFNQLTQRFNQAFQEQLSIFNQTLLSLGAIGIMPS